jgi:hypothetical protein
MLDLRIDRLRLDITNVSGQEHRIGPLVERAAALLALRIDQHWAAGLRPCGSIEAERATAPARNVDLESTGDDAVAEMIAEAWLHAMRLHLRF